MSLCVDVLVADEVDELSEDALEVLVKVRVLVRGVHVLLDEFDEFRARASVLVVIDVLCPYLGVDAETHGLLQLSDLVLCNRVRFHDGGMLIGPYMKLSLPDNG